MDDRGSTSKRSLMKALSTWRKVLFRLAVSGGLVALMFWRVDIDETLEAFLNANYIFVIPALLLYSASKLLDSQRWKMLLQRAGHAPLFGLFGIFLVSNMANNFVPVRIGDVLRVQVPAQRYNLPRGALTATVFVTETLLDGIAFVILALIGVALLDAPDPITKLVWTLLGVVIFGLVLAVLAARFRLRDDWHTHRWFYWLPDSVHKAISGFVPSFVNGLAALGDFRLGGRVLAISLVAWSLEAGMYWLLGEAFGLDIPLSSYILIMIAANMIVAMPVAPSNIGPYEIAVAEVVVALGADRSVAGGFSIGSHLIIIAWTTVWGYVAMWLLDLQFGDVFRLTPRTARPTEAESV
jgi:uncharacterized protein (TIRG00374 family)